MWVHMAIGNINNEFNMLLGTCYMVMGFGGSPVVLCAKQVCHKNKVCERRSTTARVRPQLERPSHRRAQSPPFPSDPASLLLASPSERNKGGRHEKSSTTKSSSAYPTRKLVPSTTHEACGHDKRERGFQWKRVAVGKGGAKAKRHAKKPVNNTGVTKSCMRRMASRAGVKRLAGNVYGPTRAVMDHVVGLILTDACCCAEHAKRKTIGVTDMFYALKNQGRTLFT